MLQLGIVLPEQAIFAWKPHSHINTRIGLKIEKAVSAVLRFHFSCNGQKDIPCHHFLKEDVAVTKYFKYA